MFSSKKRRLSSCNCVRGKIGSTLSDWKSHLRRSRTNLAVNKSPFGVVNTFFVFFLRFQDSKDCEDSAHGCCEDGVTAASGPSGQGCPTSTSFISECLSVCLSACPPAGLCLSFAPPAWVVPPEPLSSVSRSCPFDCPSVRLSVYLYEWLCVCLLSLQPWFPHLSLCHQ